MLSTKKTLATAVLLSVLLTLLSQTVAADAWTDIENKVKTVVCGIKNVFASTATGVAAFVMIIACVQWISSEADPGQRKKAKDTIVHAIVGLIIVWIADEIASLVIKTSCP